MRWLPLALLVALQIGYPLTAGDTRAGLVVVTVVVGCAVSLTHALLTRGVRAAGALLLVAAVGGWVVEALGVHTGVPFGRYAYTGALGPRLLGVPLVIPLAWLWMAWPAWLVAVRLTRRGGWRVLLAGWALASWDLFLDPQMVDQGYWRWAHPSPGIGGAPLTNYAGWLVVAVAMMAALAVLLPAAALRPGPDAPMYALYLWTWASSVLAHLVFLGLPASGLAGALGMGLVAVPLAVALNRSRAGEQAGPSGGGGR
jgi:putative membrane protein